MGRLEFEGFPLHTLMPSVIMICWTGFFIARNSFILIGFQEICGRLKNLENLEISVSLLNVQGFKNLDRLPVLKTLKLSMGVPKLLPKEAFEVFATLPALTELDLGVPAYGTDLSGLYGGCGTLRTLKITGMAATDELLLEWAQKLPHSVVNLHIKGATPEGSCALRKGCHSYVIMARRKM